MSGRTVGRAELEFRLNGVIDSIAFGAAGTPLEGLLVASSNLAQRPVTHNAPSAAPHGSAVWMIELDSRRVQVYIESRGGTENNPARRWEVFADLLASPRLPSALGK